MTPDSQPVSGRPFREVAFDLHLDPGRGLAFLPDGAKTFFMLLQILCEELLHWCTVPVEVLLRHRFGRRWASLVLVGQLGSIAYFFLVLGGFRLDPVLALALCIPFPVACYHWWEARQWEQQGSFWRHTYSRGEPLPWMWNKIESLLVRLHMNPDHWLTIDCINRLGQPLLCFVLGLLLLPLSLLLGGYLLAAAVALAVKAFLLHRRKQIMIWDQKDTLALGQWMAELTSAGPAAKAQQRFQVHVVSPLPARIAPEPAHRPRVPVAPLTRITFRCPGCEHRLSAPAAEKPRQSHCPRCKAAVTIPARSTRSA